MKSAQDRLDQIESIKKIGNFIIDNASTISAVTSGISFETETGRSAFVTFFEGDIINCLGLSHVCLSDVEKSIEY